MQHEYPLQIVERIARAKSIRAAAEAMSITPSALNRRLLSLEEELETPLFERLSTGVRLNAAGEIFLTHARRQLADMKAVRSKIADLKGARQGRVVIAHEANLPPESGLLKQIAAYLRRYPGVSFAVHPCQLAGAELALADYSADFALLVGPLLSAQMTRLCTATLRVSVVLQKDHPEAHRSEIRLHQITPYPWALPGSGPLREIIEGSAQRQGLVPRIALECAAGTATALVQESNGVTFEFTTADQEALGSAFARRPLSTRDAPSASLHLVQLRGRTLSVAASRFAEQLTKTFAAFSEA
ncbi:MAG: LysR substrate-binding domain-containing protein [Pseudomonadota bacterium]